MSSAITWGAEELSSTNGSQALAPLRERAVADRLNTLREVALTLLTEVESLRSAQPFRTDRSVRLYDEVQRYEIDLILAALHRTHGNQARAARLLGVRATTLNTKIKRYKISFVDSARAHYDDEEQETAFGESDSRF